LQLVGLSYHKNIGARHSRSVHQNVLRTNLVTETGFLDLLTTSWEEKQANQQWGQ
jgi:hypothetical protein